jgi:dihydroorotase-like cyclic amidohydrolase
MLGIPSKGHLAPGADADVTVVDLDTGRATWSVAGGRVVLSDGQVVGRGGHFLTTPRGAPAVRSNVAEHTVIHRDGWT